MKLEGCAHLHFRLQSRRPCTPAVPPFSVLKAPRAGEPERGVAVFLLRPRVASVGVPEEEGTVTDLVSVLWILSVFLSGKYPRAKL